MVSLAQRILDVMAHVLRMIQEAETRSRHPELQPVIDSLPAGYQVEKCGAIDSFSSGQRCHAQQLCVLPTGFGRFCRIKASVTTDPSA